MVGGGYYITTRDIGTRRGATISTMSGTTTTDRFTPMSILLPDQVIINVKRALKELGCYARDLNRSLRVDTRQALSAYQLDYGLDTTGAVDESTVASLEPEGGIRTPLRAGSAARGNANSDKSRAGVRSGYRRKRDACATFEVSMHRKPFIPVP
jgi:hypothetical protein